MDLCLYTVVHYNMTRTDNWSCKETDGVYVLKRYSGEYRAATTPCSIATRRRRYTPSLLHGYYRFRVTTNALLYLFSVT